MSRMVIFVVLLHQCFEQAVAQDTTVEFGPTYLPERVGSTALPPLVVGLRVSPASAPVRAELVQLLDELVVTYGGAEVFAGSDTENAGSFLYMQSCENLRKSSGTTLLELERMEAQFEVNRALCLRTTEDDQRYLIRLGGHSILMFYGGNDATKIQDVPTRQEHWLLPPYLFGQAVLELGCMTEDAKVRFTLDDCRRLASLLGDARGILEDELVRPNQRPQPAE